MAIALVCRASVSFDIMPFLFSKWCYFMRNSLMMRVLPATLALILSAQATAEVFKVGDIRVDGLQRISAGTVFSYLPVKPGMNFDTAHGDAAIDALYNSGLFSQVKLLRDGNTLVVDVEEFPVIAEVNLKGNKDLRSEDLQKVLAAAGISEGQSYSPQILQQLVKELTAQYQSRSKYAVQITPTIRDLPRGRVAIDLDIAEGRSARIKQINFTGNKVYSSDLLRNLVDTSTTRWNSWLTKSDQYDKSKLQADLDRIEQFYRDRGFMKAKIASTQVSLSPDRHWIYLTVNIDEGKIYQIQDYQFNGDFIIPMHELAGLLAFKRGDIYSQSAIKKSIEAIKRRLADEGYANAVVDAVPDIDKLTAQVRYNFVIVPNELTYVRHIEFSGNEKTYDPVLRRELRQMEASPYSASDIERSKERLARLPQVASIEQVIKPVPEKNDEVDIEYKLTERGTSSIQGGVGYGQTSGALFNIEYKDNNFFGTGNQLGVSFGKSASSQKYAFDFTDPYFTSDGVSINYNFNYSHTNYERENISDWASNDWGAITNFGYPLSEYQDIYFGGGIRGLSITTGQNVAPEIQRYIDEYGEKYREGVLTLSWSKDTQNRAFLPTSGSLNRINAELTLPESTDTYYKVAYRNRTYFPLTEDNDFIFSTRADISYGAGYGKTKELPFYRHYYAGGLSTLRGFKGGSLGPRYENGDFAGGSFRTTGGAELLLPWKLQAGRSDNIRFGTFLDFGNVYQDVKSFNTKDFRYSTGFFVQWLSPVGLLNLSYAFPLNKKEGDEEESFQFSLGTGF